MEIKSKNKQIFQRLLVCITKSLGPAINIQPYVDLDEKDEVEFVKNMYLHKNLGVDINVKNLEKYYSIVDSINPKIINRAILYCILTEAFDKSSIYLKSNDQLISQNPAINDGRPTIKGTRISVGVILEKMAVGESLFDVLEAYPHLTKEQVEAALKYGAKIANEKMISLEV